MRDAHRLKEKYELSLDNRQIVTVTVASLIVLGGVFLLGVIVGKKLSVEAAVASRANPERDLLGQLDDRTHALETAKSDTQPLTFQDELLKQAPVPTSEEKPAPQKPPTLVKLEPKVEAPPEKPAQEATVDPSPLAAAPKVEAVPTRTVDAGGLKEAFGKAQRTPTEVSATGTWTLQLSAYQTKMDADRFVGGLKDKGYAPYVVEAVIPGKGTWYRVRMGRFPSKDAAGRYLQDFRRETAMNAIVTQ